MPIYEYWCPANDERVQIEHSVREKFETWGALCAASGRELGVTPADSPIERLVFAPLVSTPAGDTKLKEMGFTKLVRRDSGVYENVTAKPNESRYVRSDDKTTMPKFNVTD